MSTATTSPTDKLDTAEAARHIGVSRQTLYNQLCSGEWRIPRYRIGRKLVFVRAELDAWLEEQRVDVA